MLDCIEISVNEYKKDSLLINNKNGTEFSVPFFAQNIAENGRAGENRV